METLGELLGMIESIVNTWTIIGGVILLVVVALMIGCKNEPDSTTEVSPETEPDWDADTPPIKLPPGAKIHRFPPKC